MKYWNELSNLESQIIRVGEFKNLISLITQAFENGASPEEIYTGLYTLEGMIDDINTKLYDEYSTLFDTIREETTSEPRYSFSELDAAMKNMLASTN